MSLDWRALRELPPNALQSALPDELTAVMAGATPAEEDERLDGLAAPLRVLWLLDRLDFEVAQGGPAGCFANSHGRHAARASQALRDIGATSMSAVLDAAASSPDERDELGDHYDLAAETDQWGDKLDAFLERAVADEAG